jgi:2-haloacid dehalogenase
VAELKNIIQEVSSPNEVQSLSEVRNVVFDLGGVLIDWNPRYLYRQLEEDEGKIEWFLTHVCHTDWNERQDAGRLFEEAVQELVAAYPEHEAWIRAYQERWEDMLAGPIEGTVEILAELKERSHPLYALTNWSAETFPRARELYPFLNWFDGIVVSGEVGMIKPSPEIYHHLLTRHCIEAGESVFIDDRLKNVDAARALGFQVIHYQTPGQLRRELERLNLL